MVEGRDEKFVTLDAVRGIAALTVVALHASPLFFPFSVAPNGYLAVDLFFLLSGFVIAHSYDDKIGRGLSRTDFLVRRVLRFWPLYGLGLAIGAAKAIVQLKIADPDALGLGEFGQALALNAFFLPSVFTDSLFPLNKPSWSLFFELVVNGMYCAIPTRAKSGIWVLIAVSCVGIIAAALFGHSLNTGFRWSSLHYGLARACFSFFLGVVMRRAQAHRWRLVPHVPPYALLAVTLCVLAAGRSAAPPAYALVFIFILAPAIVLFGARANAPASSRAAFEWLGRMSYPLYAVHFPILFAVSWLAGRVGVFPKPIWGVATLVALPVVAYWLDALYDRPVRRFLTKLINTSQRSPSTRLVKTSPASD